MPPADDFFFELCDLATLEVALGELESQSTETCPGFLSAEEWLINLQNHLIWGTYGPADDENADLVVLYAIDAVRRRRGLLFSEVPGRAARLLAYLTPEQGGGEGYE